MRKNTLALYFSLAMLLILLVGVSSCRIRQPEFRRVDNYRVDRNGLNFTLATDVVFFNPNRIRFKVQNLAAKVTLNSNEVASIGEEVDIKVQGKREFTVPVSISFKTENTMMNNLGSLIDMVARKDVKLGFSGNIKFKAYCIVRRELPFSFSKDINFK